MRSPSTSGWFWLTYLATWLAAIAWLAMWVAPSRSDAVTQPHSAECLTDWECEALYGPEVEVDL